ALPEGRRAEVDSVQPRGEILVEQQLVGEVIRANIRQDAAQVRCADEAGTQVRVVLLDAVDQVTLDALAVFGGREGHVQRQQEAGLRRHSQPSGGREVLRVNGGADFVR